ncbi:MAG: glycerate kinase [Firmicutes bacterium]|nr:glycerate kinase [Bacillota bacterium]
MKILIATDSFKGSLSSMAAAEAVAAGIRRVYPDAQITAVPVGDGGEGTARAMVSATGGKMVPVQVTGPLGSPVPAEFGMLPDGTAVLEMASASGLTLVPANRRDPRWTTTYGTGELIKAALDSGATAIIIGIGGSATNDGGAGMAQALGARLLDGAGKELGFGGAGLDKLRLIDVSDLDSRLKEVNIKVACDVRNPLCGPAGAAAVYGPQKGATPEMVDILDRRLEHFGAEIKKQLGIDVAGIPGSGAAGGLGAGLVAFTGAELAPGVELVLDAIKIDRLMAQVDLVITGEGRVDAQSAYGKVPTGVAGRARRRGLPVLAVAGSVGPGAEKLYDMGIDSIITIAPGPISDAEAMQKARALTADAVERSFRILKISINLGRE